MTNKEVIKELIDYILKQHERINKLEKRIEAINQYVEVYEEYLKGEK